VAPFGFVADDFRPLSLEILCDRALGHALGRRLYAAQTAFQLANDTFPGRLWAGDSMGEEKIWPPAVMVWLAET